MVELVALRPCVADNHGGAPRPPAVASWTAVDGDNDDGCDLNVIYECYGFCFCYCSALVIQLVQHQQLQQQ